MVTRAMHPDDWTAHRFDRERFEALERALFALCKEYGWRVTHGRIEEDRLDYEVMPEWSLTIQQGAAPYKRRTTEQD